MGRGGALPRPRRGPPAARLDRLLGLPLVPRDGAGVVRGPRHGRPHERQLRVREGGPGGAARRRRDLHGGVPVDDRGGRLAAERLPHPRAGALPRRHLLPAGAAARHADLAAGARGGRGGLGHAARGHPRPQRGGGRGAQGSGPADPLERAASPAAARRRRGSDRRHLRPRVGRVRRRAQVPPAAGDRAAPPARRARDVARDPPRDGRRGDLRPGGRRLRPLLRRRQVGGAALREDALRQRAPRARLPPRLAGLGRPPPRRGLRRDARLGAARDARAGGRLLLGARRRLGGRGGPLLRVDPRRASRGARRRRGGGGQVLRRHRAGQLRGPQHPHPRGRSAREARGHQAAPVRGSVSADLARDRRQAAHRLERPDDRRARRGGRRDGGPAVRGRRRRVRRVRLARAARTGRAATPDVEGRRGPGSTPTSRTTRSSWRRS